VYYTLCFIFSAIYYFIAENVICLHFRPILEQECYMYLNIESFSLYNSLDIHV